MNITRRDALLGATAAAAVTALTVAPLAIKAAGVKAALAGDPVLPAFEAFEVKRREYLAMDNRIDAAREVVEAGMPPQPHPGRTILEMSAEEQIEHHAWYDTCFKRTEAILGGNEDDLLDPYYVSMRAAYNALIGIEAATFDGLLCQVRAWWAMYERPRDPEVEQIDPEDWHYLDGELVMRRVYHDIARLAGEARS